MKKNILRLILTLFMVFIGNNISAQNLTAEEAVVSYIDGMYTGDSLQVANTLAKDFTKTGFSFNQESKTFTKEEISMEMLFSLSNYLSDMEETDDKMKKNILVLDKQEKIASAKLEALWGIELLHLFKEENGWKIKQIIWQGYTQ